MAQKWLVNKIIKVLGQDELTVNEVITRLQDEGKIARNVSRMQVAGLMSKNKSFEKVKDPIKKHATVWRNKHAMD
mgnify:FL=1